MILYEPNKNKVTIIKHKGGRPRKQDTTTKKNDHSTQKARHDFEEETKAELLEDTGGET